MRVVKLTHGLEREREVTGKILSGARKFTTDKEHMFKKKKKKKKKQMQNKTPSDINILWYRRSNKNKTFVIENKIVSSGQRETTPDYVAIRKLSGCELTESNQFWLFCRRFSREYSFPCFSENIPWTDNNQAGVLGQTDTILSGHVFL